MLVTSMCMLKGKDDLEAREFVAKYEDLTIEPFENLEKGSEPLSTLPDEMIKRYCPAHMGLEIVQKRHLTQETIERWRLRYDSVEGRLMFPVYNAKGNLVGFRGRATGTGVKYREYSEIQPKKQSLKGHGIWFGMNFKVENPKQKIILVEGEIDAVKLSQALANRPGIWAAMGSSISDEQIKTIQALKNPIVLFFDNDEAGVDAKNKMLKRLSKVKAGVFVVENYYNMKDPDEIADKGFLSQALKSMQRVG